MDPRITYLHIVALRVHAKLQVFAALEPVRLRAALTSLVLAGACLVPALAGGEVAETIGAAGAVVLPVLVGESTRSKVTPVG
ncbi:hypothetical protein [Streptomyces sp. NPDC086782]|uniref:hypothetical protein n=1 Tax=Streptomyces sp. NPDC086782 TaxID=3365757 RepID=UPI003829FA21